MFAVVTGVLELI